MSRLYAQHCRKYPVKRHGLHYTHTYIYNMLYTPCTCTVACTCVVDTFSAVKTSGNFQSVYFTIFCRIYLQLRRDIKKYNYGFRRTALFRKHVSIHRHRSVLVSSTRIYCLGIQSVTYYSVPCNNGHGARTSMAD